MRYYLAVRIGPTGTRAHAIEPLYITQHCPIEIVRHVGNERLDREPAGKTELGT